MNKCKICGKEFEKSIYNDNLHLCSEKCHSIDFWNQILDDNAIIINGECYHAGRNRPDEKRTYLLGHSGTKFKIQFKNTGEIVETNNLWYNGVVPTERNIDDNAIFLKP